MSRFTLAGLAVVSVLTAAAPAAATFPGRNGRLVYWMAEDHIEANGYATSINTLDVRRPARIRILRRCRRFGSNGGDNVGCSLSPARYSPDGRSLAFYITRYDGRGGARQSLTIVRADGSAAREVDVPADVSGAEWSPDGRHLLVGREGEHGLNLFVMDLSGHIGRRVATDVLDPDWSPRGQIAFDDDENVFVVRRPGGKPRQLTHTGGILPSWAPDGRRLLFSRDLGRSHYDVFSVRLNGGGLRRYTRREAGDAQLSPDGRWLVFEREASIYVSRLGRGRARLVAQGNDPLAEDVEVGDADWQPLPKRNR
jgi:Tol biopolymer transport system component